jgi:hypothetical protein
MENIKKEKKKEKKDDLRTIVTYTEEELWIKEEVDSHFCKSAFIKELVVKHIKENKKQGLS